MRDDRAGAALAWLTAACPYLFLVLGLAGSLFLAFIMPPFQGADELAHSLRVSAITHGQVVGERSWRGPNLRSGGPVDPDLWGASAPFDNIRFNPIEKVDRVDFAGALPHRLGGPAEVFDFRGASMYPPVFYLPAAAGFTIGRLTAMPVTDGLYAGRLLQAVACVVLGFLALRRFGRGRLLVFSVLLLPMSMALYSAVTNDGLLIATTALGCGIVARPMVEGRAMRTSELTAAAVCFALVGMTKPPYGLIGLVFLVVPAERPRQRWLAAAVVLGLTIGWSVFTAAMVQVPLTRADAALDPSGQVAYLLANPHHIVPLALRTLATHWKAYYVSSIGALGWQDTRLPEWYYPAAATMLGVAAVAAASRGQAHAWRWTPAVAVLAILLAFGAIHAALYINWTAVANPVVEGVAGRYFLPLACMLPLAFEGARPLIPDTRSGQRVRLALTALVLAFPLLTLLAMQKAVIFRYYLD